MAQAAQLTKDDLDAFDSILKDAYDKPWWRLFVQQIETRRMSFLNGLVEGVQDQRDEDRMRGRINELTWLMHIDARGKFLNEEEKGK
jgi:hypothetical protein